MPTIMPNSSRIPDEVRREINNIINNSPHIDFSEGNVVECMIAIVQFILHNYQLVKKND